MFGIGFPELVLILVLALIVFGPDKLPQLARQIARLVWDLKKASEEFKDQLNLDEALRDIENQEAPDKTASGQGKQRSGKEDTAKGGKEDTKSSSPESEKGKRN